MYVILADRTDASNALALQAEAALLSAAVVYWATSTMLERPSAALAAAPADPAALIGKLQLVAPAGGGAPRLQVSAPALPPPPQPLQRLPLHCAWQSIRARPPNMTRATGVQGRRNLALGGGGGGGGGDLCKGNW